jgi:RNA polymerase II C-terminal domain phosphatase-like 3/4
VAATAGVTSTPDITSLLLPLPPAASQQHQRQQHGQQPHGPRQQRGPRRGPPPAATAAASGQHILIVASDGLWEFVSSAEAVRIAARCTCAAAAAERLVQEARAQWASRFGGQLCDDVTVAVAFLPGAPPSAGAAPAGQRRGSRRRRPQGNSTAAAAAAAR